MAEIKKPIGNIPIPEIKQEIEREVEESAGVLNDVFKLQEDSEFLDVEIDNEEKILSSRNKEGIKREHIGFETPKMSIDGHTIDNFEDPEKRTEITTDAKGKIISYRDSEGVKHEEVGLKSRSVETNKVITKELTGLSDEGLTEFEQMLKNHGFRPGGEGDWSDYISEDGAKPLCLSEPRCAMLNILSDINLTTLSKKGRPDAQKGVNYAVPVQVEFWDMQGNYFKKWVEISGQGNSSMGFAKKNIAMDFFDDETMDGVFSTKFGDWVAQDSYHFKSFYTDFFKGVSVIAYKIAMQAQKTRGIFNDISWKNALIDKNLITDNPWDYTISDLNMQTNNEARCMPDGFPVIIYQNGEFYGVFAQCLKKHRDNYHMSKSAATNIHLDGLISDTTVFDTNGNVNWNEFEVRNPKDLYYKTAHTTMAGKSTYKYDADDPGQFEIADQTTVDAWIAAGQLPDGTAITSKIKKALKTCAKVHKYITDLSYCYRTFINKPTVEEKKESFETYFDPDNLIDYLIINMALADGDGFGPNWQWTTWDGKKWYVNQYDKDNTFGSDSKGFFINSVRNPMSWYGSGSYIIAFVISNYMDRIVARWNELVSKGVFTKENFLKITNEWVARIGYNNLEKEYKEKWIESPCCRDPKVSDNWKVNRIYYTPTYKPDTYNSETTYMIGDTVEIFQSNFMIVFECIVNNTQGIFPCYRYSMTPQYLGFYDNIWRVAKFIEKNLDSVNNFINSNSN